MNSTVAIGLTVLAAFLAAVSQIILKKSALIHYTTRFREYFNWLVMGSYALLFFTMFLSMISMKYLPYKFLPILNTSSYLFVLLFSICLFGEKVSLKRRIGVVFIVIGIVIFGI